jgi:hypothetical protein
MQELLEHKHRVKSRDWLAGERRRTRGRAALGPSFFLFLQQGKREETVERWALPRVPNVAVNTIEPGGSPPFDCRRVHRL